MSNDDLEDAAFRQAHPDRAGKTIRVQGTRNGEPFTFESDLNEEQEFYLEQGGRQPGLVTDHIKRSLGTFEDRDGDGDDRDER